MSLDLKKVITQIANVEKQETRELNLNRLKSTYELFKLASQNKEKLLRKLIETQSSQKANFFFAEPYKDESIQNTFDWNKDFSTPHITIATDGSQINPSAHEITSSSLINIGLVAIPYFNSNTPVLLSSEPTLYSSTEDIAPYNFSQNIQEEDLISYERTLKEIEELVKLVKKYTSYNLPVVALLDGTLIHWHLEKFNNFFIERFIKRFTNALLELKLLGVPLASFLSNSRSNDIINMLRVYNCPFEFVDCKKHCSNIDSKNLQCNPMPDYKPVLDRKLIGKSMSEKKSDLGTRTILFKSNSKILNYYSDDLKISFFYINTGTEIARVEFPAYVANDSKLFNLLHNAVALQCKVGFGYPVTLGEAHLQAVVNKTDRQIFYDLLREHLLKNTQSTVKLSNKEFKKRISFV